MARHDDAVVPPSVEERRMARWLDEALVYRWKEDGGGGRTLHLSSRNPLYEFFDLMMRMGDAGYVLAATLFGRKAVESGVERAVRSRLLTLLARGLHEAHHDARATITESSVAHFGRFVNVLIAEMPRAYVEWAEDMDVDDPRLGLRKQPVAVIRGVFLSPSLDQRKCAKFWELAAESDRFPVRIFSEPCGPDDGAIFSSYHLRAFAIVFTVAPEPAVAKFAGHMRERATHKLVRRLRPDEDRWTVESEPATENERMNAFRCIAGGIEPHARRERVSTLLGVGA